MSELLRFRWEPQVDGTSLTRRDRQGCNYEAYVPDSLIGRKFALEGTVAADVADAERKVTELDCSALTLGDTETLARLLLRAESVASSRIEGLEIGPRRLLQADAAREDGETISDVTAVEVLGNIDAMAYAASSIKEGANITKDHIVETHLRLLSGTGLARHAGRLRTVQNWIGGSNYNPCSAAFVPPPPDRIEALLDDLFRFCNDDSLPTVAQAATAHAQFETIHPFVDGNGRVGRALIHMILRRRGLAKRILPPISLVLATHAQDYVNALTRTRYLGDPTSAEAMESANYWMALFAGACVRAVGDAEAFEVRVREIKRQWRERLGPVRSHAAVQSLLDVLPGAPIITVKSAAELTNRSVPAVNEAIARLENAGILHQPRARAWSRTFEAREIIDAFIGLERQLASPAGDTRIEAPVREVPRWK